MTMQRFSFIVLMAFQLAGLCVSGQVKFTTVISNKEVGLNEYVQVEFRVENAREIDQLTPPSLPGFRILQGPVETSESTNNNGKLSQHMGLLYVLQPVKTGKFTITGATATIDGHPMHSNPVNITVITAGTGNANPPPVSNPLLRPGWPNPAASFPEDAEKEYLLKPGENIQNKIHKNLFVKVQVDKTSCFAGEPLVAVYKLYSRLRSESRVTKRPSLNGFSVYDMVDPNSDVSSEENVNGKPFTVHIIRKAQLIPLQAGTMELDPVEVENTVHFMKGTGRPGRTIGRGFRDLFDAFEDDDAVTSWIDKNVTLDTKPLAITVKPLPETSKPDEFNGAVGRFDISSKLENNNIASGDEATLQVTISGSGNLPVINAPQVHWPAGLEAFDPVAKEQVDKTKVPMSGSKVFSYVFTPKSPGVYQIPAIPFSYFDPATRTYKRLHTDSIQFRVGPPLKKNASSRVEGTDSPGSRGGSEAGGFLSDFIGSHLEWLFALLIFSGLGFYFWRQNLRSRAQETAPRPEPGKEKESAPLVNAVPVMAVADPLSHARQLMADNNYKGFYRELNRALHKAVADKLNLPASESNKVNILRELEARGWDREQSMQLDRIFSECEINLYTPVYDTYNMQQMLELTESLIGKI